MSNRILSHRSIDDLHEDDINRVNVAIANADKEFGSSLLSLNDVNFGMEFDRAVDVKLSKADCELTVQ